MAYLDPIAQQKAEEKSKSYDALKDEILNNKKLKKFYPALEKIHEMEGVIQKQEEELKSYREFFSLMNDFLPKNNNNGRIG